MEQAAFTAVATAPALPDLSAEIRRLRTQLNDAQAAQTQAFDRWHESLAQREGAAAEIRSKDLRISELEGTVEKLRREVSEATGARAADAQHMDELDRQLAETTAEVEKFREMHDQMPHWQIQDFGTYTLARKGIMQEKRFDTFEQAVAEFTAERDDFAARRSAKEAKP